MSSRVRFKRGFRIGGSGEAEGMTVHGKGMTIELTESLGYPLVRRPTGGRANTNSFGVRPEAPPDPDRHPTNPIFRTFRAPSSAPH